LLELRPEAPAIHTVYDYDGAQARYLSQVGAAEMHQDHLRAWLI